MNTNAIQIGRRLPPMMLAGVLAAILGSSGQRACAQGTWDGGAFPDGNFSAALNWVGDAAPPGNGALVFDGSANLLATNDLTLTAADNAITFSVGAGAFSLYGGPIRAGNVINNSAFVQTINLNLRYNGGRNIDTGNAGIILGVAPTSTGGGRTVTKLGAGALTMRGNTTGGNVSYAVNAGSMVFDTESGQTTSIGSGTITLASGTQLLLNNAGTVTFTTATANSGSSIVLGNAGTVNGAVVISSGANLTGIGSLAGAVSVSGNIAPGASIGTMNVASLTLDSTSTTTMEIDRAAGQNADLITVSGALAYGGALNVGNIGGALELGDSFNLFDFTSQSGSFGSTNLPSLNNGLAWSFDYSSGVLSVITAVPEPATVVLLLGGLCALVGFRVRSRQS